MNKQIKQSELINSSDVMDIFTASEDLSLPVVIILQGVNIDKSSYSLLANKLNDFGFCVVVPNSHVQDREFLCPDGQTIPKVLASLEKNHFQMDGKKRNFALIGHSAGGIAAFSYALAQDNRENKLWQLRSIITYGSNAPTWLGSLQISCPVLYAVGKIDNIVPSDVSLKAFQKTQTQQKFYICFDKMNHYAITNEPQPPDGPEETKFADISQEQSIAILAKLYCLFLEKQFLAQKEIDQFIEEAQQLGTSEVLIK